MVPQPHFSLQPLTGSKLSEAQRTLLWRSSEQGLQGQSGAWTLALAEATWESPGFTSEILPAHTGNAHMPMILTAGAGAHCSVKILCGCLSLLLREEINKQKLHHEGSARVAEAVVYCSAMLAPHGRWGFGSWVHLKRVCIADSRSGWLTGWGGRWGLRQTSKVLWCLSLSLSH